MLWRNSVYCYERIESKTAMVTIAASKATYFTFEPNK